MTEIRFYHLETQTMEQALPGLLAKALGTGQRILVKASSESAVEKLNEYLWTYNPDSFLPHGSSNDGFAADQPIWITAGEENPNGAQILILTQGAGTETPEQFSLCCELFDGGNDEALQQARARWAAYKQKGLTLTYWQQTAKGWEKKEN